MDEISTRVETETEVRCYLQDLRYALNNGAKITFQVDRLVDQKETNDIQTNLR